MRSTISTLGQRDETCGLIRPLDNPSTVTRASIRFHRALELRPLIAAVGIKLDQERKAPNKLAIQQRAAVAILDVGGVHDGVHQQALRIDQDVPLLTLDLLACIVAVRSMPGPFPALLMLWLSMIAAVRLASREAAGDRAHKASCECTVERAVPSSTDRNNRQSVERGGRSLGDRPATDRRCSGYTSGR